MTNPSEIESHPIESHPVETLKAQKQHHDAAHPSLTETPLEVAEHPLPPLAQGGLNALAFHGSGATDVIGVPYFPPKEGHEHHEHHHHKHEHDVHHEGHAHDHMGNPDEPLKDKKLGFEYHQLPTM
ncbi:hypothetical protein FBU30_002277 [Linnemannia zychae]|nr:hypothetical protein FBU30_002277 [Linnemannia zychae]